MRISILIILISLLGACGKVEQLQNSFSNMMSSDDLIQKEVQEGVAYKSTGASGDYSWIEFGNTRYRIASLAPAAQAALDQMSTGVSINVYFKGSFDRRVIDGSLTEYDVIDVQLLNPR